VQAVLRNTTASRPLHLISASYLLLIVGLLPTPPVGELALGYRGGAQLYIEFQQSKIIRNERL
jgi:hypothetical protein